LLHVDAVEAQVLKAAGNIFCCYVWGKVMDYCLYRRFRIWGEGKIVEIIFFQV
jgi:hypothetical protein